MLPQGEQPSAAVVLFPFLACFCGHHPQSLTWTASCCSVYVCFCFVLLQQELVQCQSTVMQSAPSQLLIVVYQSDAWHQQHCGKVFAVAAAALVECCVRIFSLVNSYTHTHCILCAFRCLCVLSVYSYRLASAVCTQSAPGASH